MKILFVWTGVTGYMADCWRALQQLPGVELKVVVEQAACGKDFDLAKVSRGLDYELVPLSAGPDHLCGFQKAGWTPDVLFAGGWRSRNTRRIVKALPAVTKIFCTDMPWRWKLRCIVARWALRPFLGKFDGIYVPGELSARYARWLGFPQNRIRRKLLSVDFGLVQSADLQKDGRTGFLFLGRFAPEKRVDLMIRAYVRYRELGGTWSFDIYGAGPLEEEIVRAIRQSGCPTVRRHPFAQPDQLKEIWLSHACLLLASKFDRWPLVIVEARAAGLEVVASDRCGNAEELGARRVPYEDIEAMAREMLRTEREWMSGKARSPVGKASPYARDYDCAAWARRTLDLARRLMRIRGFCPGLDEISNGIAVVARLLAQDEAFRNDYIVHGMWLPRGWLACARHFGDFVRMTHGSLSPLYLEHQGKWKKRLVKPIERFLLRRAKKVLATCAAEKEWILAYEPKAKVEVVEVKKYFGVEKVEKVERVERGERVNLLYLGRRHPLKGIEYLERAVEGLEVNLRIVSDAADEEKERAWTWCDVLVLPTLSENFGLVVAEALERGKRVIVTDGAPAWGDGDYGGRLTYVRGYRDGSAKTRVELLKTAILGELK